jgi:hypothetical protein
MSDEDRCSFCSVTDPCTSDELSQRGVQLLLYPPRRPEDRGLAFVGLLTAKLKERGEGEGGNDMYCDGSCREYRIHRVVMITFWCAFHHDGKISPCLVRVGDARPPTFTLSTITSKVVVYAPLQLRGQIHSPCFSSTPTCTLWQKALPTG